MGVDARMFLVIRGKENWKTAAEVKKLAVELAQTFGAGNFLIGARGNDKPIANGQRALEILQPDAKGRLQIWNDGPNVDFDPKLEQLLEVNMFTRYYGPDYARGDWTFIRGVAEWLELKFPEGEVWYGGDSSGVLVEPFPEEVRKEYNDHFLTHGRRSYYGGWSDMLGKGRALKCPSCDIDMVCQGGGQGKSFFWCDGCDAKAIKSDNDTKWLEHGKDFLEASK